MYLESDSPINLGGGNNGNCDGFGSGWWGIILIALLFGWGRGFGGYGNGNDGNSGGAMNNYVLGSDFASLSRQIDNVNLQTTQKLNSIGDGICSLGYDQLAQMNGINNNLVTQGFETRTAIAGIGTQMASCCCDLKTMIADVNYNMAMNTNVLQQTLCNNTRDIIDNQNANYRLIHDELIANKIEAKNDIIAQQQATINALQLKASQEAQNAYLINALQPCPKPAYIVQNPNCCYNGCNTSVL